MHFMSMQSFIHVTDPVQIKLISVLKKNHMDYAKNISYIEHMMKICYVLTETLRRLCW